MPLIVQDVPIALASGTQEIGPLNVRNNMDGIRLILKRCTTATPAFWPSETTTIEGRIYMSAGPGQPFNFLCGFGAAGGIHVSARTGIESPVTSIECPINRTNGRRVRMEITVTNGPLVTEATVEEL